MEDNTLKNKNKSKYIGIFIGLAIVAALAVGATYAYWVVQKSQTDSNEIVAACLNITMGQEANAGINISEAWPITRTEAMNTVDGYDFTITNNCDQSVNYILGLENLPIEGLAADKYLSNSYIYVGLDDSLLGTYWELLDVTKVNNNARFAKGLGSFTLEANATDSHTLKLWISDNAPVTEQGKSFSGKVTVTAGQNIENVSVAATSEECFTIDVAGQITAYDKTCGQKVIIPAKINNINVVSIDSDAFKEESFTTNVSYNNGHNESDYLAATDMAIVIRNYNSSLNIFEGTNATNIQYLIVYDNNTDVQNYINGLYQQGIGAGLFTNETKPPYYVVGTDTVPTLAYTDSELDFSVENDPVDGIVIEPTRVLNYNSGGKELVINSLDLSKAINLDSIENFAFSNFDETNWRDAEPEDIAYGLTFLTFGNNDKDIEIGFGAFAKCDLDTLRVYASSYPKTYTGNESDAPIGYLALSTIDNFTLAPGNTTTMIKGKGYTSPTPDAPLANLDIITGIFLGITANTINIADGITAIDDGTFAGTTFNTLNIASSVTSIGKAAFYGTKTINITIPDTVTTIKESAFGQTNGTITLTGGTEGKTLGTSWNGNTTVN